MRSKENAIRKKKGLPPRLPEPPNKSKSSKNTAKTSQHHDKSKRPSLAKRVSARALFGKRQESFRTNLTSSSCGDSIDASTTHTCDSVEGSHSQTAIYASILEQYDDILADSSSHFFCDELRVVEK